jgi:hypothetical protein
VNIRPSWIYALLLLVGLMDALTGALLMAAPLWTLNLMGITVLPVEPVYQRWIGAFVCSVGCSYLFPFLLRAGRERDQRATGILTMATIVRLFIASFSGVAIATGALEPAWLSVTFTDATLAVLQIIVLRKKVLESV